MIISTQNGHNASHNGVTSTATKGHTINTMNSRRQQHASHYNFPTIAFLPFQAFGLSPIGPTTRHNLLAKCLSLVSLLLAIGIVGSAIFLTGFVQTNSLQTIVAVMIFSAEITTNLVSIVQSLLTRRIQTDFIIGMSDIDGMLLAETSAVDRAAPRPVMRFGCSAGLAGIATVMFAIMSTELLYAWLRSDNNALRFKLQLLYPMTANRMRCLQTIYFADKLRKRLRRLAEAIRATSSVGFKAVAEHNINKAPKNLNNRRTIAAAAVTAADLSAVLRRQRLQRLKRVYSELWCNAARLNYCFGWSLLSMIAQHFIHMTAQGYWVFLTLQGQLPVTQYTESALGIGAVVWALFMLCNSCDGCAVEVPNEHEPRWRGFWLG